MESLPCCTYAPELRTSPENSPWIHWKLELPRPPVYFGHMSRYLWRSPSGLYMQTEWVVRETLEKFGFSKAFVSENIPWTFFRKYSRTPVDPRVRQIIKSTGLTPRLIARRTVWKNTRGYPDILAINYSEMTGWEVKAPNDHIREEQIAVARSLDNLGIISNLVDVMPLVSESQGAWNSRQQYKKFVESDVFQKLEHSCLFPFERYSMVRADGGDLLRETSRNGNALVMFLWLYGMQFSWKEPEESWIEIVGGRGWPKGRPNCDMEMFYSVYQGIVQNVLQVSQHELLEIAVSLFLGGSTLWWMVVPVLAPFLSPGPMISEMKLLAEVCSEWEDTFKTVHINYPNLQSYMSQSPFHVPLVVKKHWNSAFLKSYIQMNLDREFLSRKNQSRFWARFPPKTVKVER